MSDKKKEETDRKESSTKHARGSTKVHSEKMIPHRMDLNQMNLKNRKL